MAILAASCALSPRPARPSLTVPVEVVPCGDTHILVTRSEVSIELALAAVPGLSRPANACIRDLASAALPGLDRGDLPLTCVSQDEARAIAAALGPRAVGVDRNGNPHHGTFRLPTRADRACFSGAPPAPAEVCAVANVKDASYARATGMPAFSGFVCDDGTPLLRAVSEGAPNEHGLVEVWGNLAEWLDTDGEIVGGTWLSGPAHELEEPRAVPRGAAPSSVIGIRLVLDERGR